MANRWFTQFYGTLHKKPVTLDCNFTVAAGDASGEGISGLKGLGIAGVYMNSTASFAGDTHTNTVIDGIADTSILEVGMRLSGAGIAAGTTIASITSATAIVVSLATTATAAGVTITYGAAGSSNPAAGNILVKFQDNYNRYFFGGAQLTAPLTGTPIAVGGTALTVGQAYVITDVSTTTAAEWAALGVPVGTTAAIGVSFIAALTGSGAGSGRVQLATASALTSIELVGSPNLMLTSTGPINVSGSGSGAYMLLQCVAATAAGDTTLIKTAPAAGTLIRLSFFLGNSSILSSDE